MALAVPARGLRSFGVLGTCGVPSARALWILARPPRAARPSGGARPGAFMVDMNTPTALALMLAALVAGSSLLVLGCATDVLDARSDGDAASGAGSTSGSSGAGGSSDSSSSTGTGGMDCSQKVPCTPTFLGPIAAGGEHACAVTATGALKCWGSSSQGQLGNGTQSYSTGAVPVLVFS